MNMMPPKSAIRAEYLNEVERALALVPMDADLDARGLAAAFVASPYASFILDISGRIIACNRRAERVYCPATLASPDDMRGAPFCDLTGADEAEMRRMLRDGAAKGSVEVDMTTPKRPGISPPVVFRVVLLLSIERGERLYLLTQDHLKATAEALAEMNQRRVDAYDTLARFEARYVDMHASLVAMETFAQKASHDLKTPLNTLSGLLHLMSVKFAEDMPEKAQEYVTFMQRAVQQMDGMTTDFLEHARSMTADVTAEPVNLWSVLKDVKSSLQNGMVQSDMTIDIEGSGLTLMAEPTLLRMLVTNLLSNAIKYRHPQRALKIAISVRPQGDGSTVLRICDNGQGFDPAESDAIFLPYRRLATTTEGTGIGLSTCSEVCRRHGWSISATSDGHSGAEFKVVFPKLS